MSTDIDTRTRTLAYVIAETGAPSEDWLRRRLNAGEIRGRSAGHTWRMTDSDIAALVAWMAKGPGADRCPVDETRTHPLAHVVAETGVASEDWLRRRLNAGKIRGRLVGRTWRMTDSDIAALVAWMAKGPGTEADSLVADMTPTTRRRMLRAS
ncbi:hypothetical protein GV792_04930 [Nocardia cyriacigeorgica]|uniref:hypothetical protein n=1 Tax=Nocardia cyriacigeorgica TaxID=135487 RepID=UPI0013B7D9C5|nr:hypothetical protein [Nocardia cyriacigeorgica]NEW49388.1 hypothetical protein [Nocardia cyriacigeorgica]